MEAPGIRTLEAPPRKSIADALRADVVGFSGVFERGPVFAPVRIEDAGELRKIFGGPRLLVSGPAPSDRKHALAPLCLYGFHKNGGRSSVIVRLAGRGAAPALGRVLDPATGLHVGLVASSPGSWGAGVTLRVPLRVRRRLLLPGGFEAPAPGSALPEEGAIARVSSVADPDARAFGHIAAAAGKLHLRSAMAVPAGDLVVEELDPQVDVVVEGPSGSERHRGLSLDPHHPRYLWRYFETWEVRAPWARVEPEAPEGSRDWLGAIEDLAENRGVLTPEAWQPLPPALALALEQQAWGPSQYLRSVLPLGWEAFADLGPELVLPDLAAARPFGAPPWDRLDSLPRSDGPTELVAALVGGGDDVAGLRADAFEAAIESLAIHPAPSIVCLPELMLSQAPQLPECKREPFEYPALEPLPAPPGPCGEPPELAAPIPSPPANPPAPLHAPPAPEIPSMTGADVEFVQQRLVAELVRHSDTRGDRVALLDALPGLGVGDAVAASRGLESLVRDVAGRAPYAPSLGALLHPWVRMNDPRAPDAAPVLVPACGHVAGVMARTARAGSPGARFANLTLRAVVGVERALGESERATLNDGHVCALVSFPGAGTRVLGARSLWSDPDPLRYFPAARVLAYLRRALREVGRTVVFEPNDSLLQLRIRFALETVLSDLLRRNVLAGRSADEAYRVCCDENTTPPQLAAEGVVVAEVQVAPAIPLEFVTIRIGFTRDGAAVDEYLPEVA